MAFRRSSAKAISAAIRRLRRSSSYQCGEVGWLGSHLVQPGSVALIDIAFARQPFRVERQMRVEPSVGRDER